VSPKRYRLRIAFGLVALLGILALFVLDGAAAGVAALVTLLGLVFACVAALRRYDADVRSSADRTGLAGWLGGWF
jgi:hypothetical protein